MPSKSSRISADGNTQKVRYVFRKGSQIFPAKALLTMADSRRSGCGRGMLPAVSGSRILAPMTFWP